MERIPFLFEPQSIPLSQVSPHTFDFQFPTPISHPQNQILFCGKLITLQTQPHLHHTPGKLSSSDSLARLKSGQDKHSGSLRSSSTGENRCRRSSSSRKHNNGLFGILKFPLQMELSDIKMRQARREPVTLLKLPAGSDGEPVTAHGEQSCWDLVRPLRRRGPLMSALAKATFGCIPLV